MICIRMEYKGAADKAEVKLWRQTEQKFKPVLVEEDFGETKKWNISTFYTFINLKIDFLQCSEA